MVREWFDSITDAQGEVHRDELRTKIKADYLNYAGLLANVFDGRAVKSLGKAFERLGADAFTFEEFVAVSKLRPGPGNSVTSVAVKWTRTSSRIESLDQFDVFFTPKKDTHTVGEGARRACWPPDCASGGPN